VSGCYVNVSAISLPVRHHVTAACELQFIKCTVGLWQRCADADTSFDVFADMDAFWDKKKQICLLWRSYFLATIILQNSSCICSFYVR